MDNGASSYHRFLEGDLSGFTEIVRDYKDGLILYLCAFTNDINTAEDLAEDTFVKLGIKRPKDSGKSSFKTWLYTIGRNLAIDYIRKNSKHSEVPLDSCYQISSDEKSLEEAYIQEEEKLAVHRAMRKLKPEYRQALYLIYFEDFSNKETARIMKKSVHATETFLYRARLALKDELLKEGFTYENV